MSSQYYDKYLKYKKKYLEIKENKKEITGGGKRYLRGDDGKVNINKVDKEDIMTLTPMGSPTRMNTFLLGPEINFIANKCSKEKDMKKHCTPENITNLLTQFYNFETTNESVKKNLSNVSKSTNLKVDFIEKVLKYHRLWKTEKFLKFE